MLAAKLELITEAFEGAAYSAGLTTFRGFDHEEQTRGAVDVGSAAAVEEEGAGGGGAGGVPALDATATSGATVSSSAAAVLSQGRRDSVYRFVPPVFSVCAFDGDGVEALVASLSRLSLPRQWEYSASTATDLSPLERVTEVIREKLFTYLHREVPYGVRQVNRSWREGSSVRRPTVNPAAHSSASSLSFSDYEAQYGRNSGGDSAEAAASLGPDGLHSGPPDLTIDQDIVVPSKRVSAMLTARGGGPIKAITREAIADLQAEMGRRVHLFLHIRVQEPGSAGAAAAAAGAGM